MIAPVKKRNGRKSVPAWHEGFLAMLPGIQRHAKVAFRDLKPEAREEAVQEVIANATVAYARLAELGKTDLAYPTVLAKYAVAQVKDGRKVGTKSNVRDVSSPYAQMRKGITLQRLDRYDKEEQQWQEVLVEDRHAGPAEVAGIRIDFSAWLRTLPRRERRIAETLATGETTTAAARKFHVSAGRISQLRRQLAESWWAFVGEHPRPRQPAFVTA